MNPEMLAARAPARSQAAAAASQGDLVALGALARGGHSLDEPDVFGWTPLLYAAANGRHLAVAELLRHGARCEHSAVDGMTALLAAVEAGDVRSTELLLAAGASASTTLDAGEGCGALWSGALPLLSAVAIAAARGQGDVLGILVRHGARRWAWLAPAYVLARLLAGGAGVRRVKKGLRDRDPLYGDRFEPEVFAFTPAVELSPKELRRAFEDIHCLEGGKRIEAGDAVFELDEVACARGESPPWRDGLCQLGQLDRQLRSKSLVDHVFGGRPLDAEHLAAHVLTAARRGEHEIVRTLLAMHETPALRATAIEGAAAYARDELLAMLLADPGSRPDGAALGSALREATGKGRLDAVQALVRAGAEVDAADELGRRASWLAAWNGRADILEVLLSAGAKVDSRTGFGDTPLHAAARFGGAAIVRALLAAGADPDATNSLGDTPLSCAAEAPSAPAQVVDLLLDARAHIDHANAHGQTALMLATRNVLDKGSPSAFDRLVERGAALDLVDDEGRTALLHGILISNYDFARAIRLVDAGADPGVKDHAGRTAADYLARYSDIDAAHAIRALLGVQQATP